ncbi:ABC transporter substrate-binding protein [Amycolatopsis jejuensis]|uniref:ABC transporter substrate-binding protein n=1 Tax=Amycolatopsis jejuensis TaxID=330084 RepID=UPI000526C1E2|nr:ABC transporter substrate-binding protein [Amycolatopsis jejuensis]
MTAVSVLAVAGLAMVAGCGGGSSGAGEPQAATDAKIPKLSWALPSPVPNLDYAQFPGRNPVVPLVNEPLERLSSKNVYTPVLATSVAQPNPATLVYTIRSGVTFSDGQPLTADDVVWSIRHYAAETAASATFLPDIKNVSATGPLSVTVDLGKPDPIARGKLASNVFVMEKQFSEAHANTLGTAAAIPVGTGPYTVAGYTAQSIVLKNNPRHWGVPPKVENIDFPIITDNNAFKLALQSGTVDGGQVADPQTLDQWRKVPGASVHTAPSTDQVFLQFNVTAPPFDDVHVRRAIAYAVDKAAYAKVGFGGNVDFLAGLVPASELAGVAGSADAAQAFLTSLPQYPFDVAKAKAEMAQSKHPQGFSTTVEYNESTGSAKQTALVLQQNLQAIGVRVELKPITGQQRFAELTSGTLPPFGTGGFDAAVNDPSALLTTMVGAGNIENTARWSTPAVAAAVSIVDSSASTPAERWAATKTILSAVASDVPYLGLFTRPTASVLRQGFVFAGKEGIDATDLNDGNWAYQIRAGK